jgi:hypothetical protein
LPRTARLTKRRHERRQCAPPTGHDRQGGEATYLAAGRQDWWPWPRVSRGHGRAVLVALGARNSMTLDKDPGHGFASKYWYHVVREDALVPQAARTPLQRVRLRPTFRHLCEGGLACCRVEPGSSRNVGCRSGQPSQCIRLGGEGLRRNVTGIGVPIASLILTRRGACGRSRSGAYGLRACPCICPPWARSGRGWATFGPANPAKTTLTRTITRSVGSVGGARWNRTIDLSIISALVFANGDALTLRPCSESGIVRRFVPQPCLTRKRLAGHLFGATKRVRL